MAVYIEKKRKNGMARSVKQKREKIKNKRKTMKERMRS